MPGVGRQHTLEPRRRFRRTLGHDDLTGVQAIADADADAVMDADPRRAAHAAQSSGENKLAAQAAPAVLLRQRSQRLISSLQDALRADVNPRASRHLAVHDETLFFPLVKVFLRGPGRDDVRIGEQDTRRVGVRLENADGLAGLNQQCLVVFERLEATIASKHSQLRAAWPRPP